jgi:adenylate cyclase
MGMEALVSSDTFLFENFRFDRRGALFRRNDGAEAPVAIGSRALDILSVLVARAGEVVSKDEIAAVVWPGRIVEDSNLTVQITALRRVLDVGPSEGSCIQTIASRGYRFVAAVKRIEGRTLSGREPSAQLSEYPLPRLSIVVLPFVNLSYDPEQQYFADGITDDLTTDLSRLANMFVISRNTAFTYKDKRVDTKQIGRELGVRYVLEGSVRQSSGQIRVNAQLIDGETDAHLWAERFDREMGDLFALQNEITGRIAIALNLEITSREAARPTNNPDALDYILRARDAMYKLRSRDSLAEAISLFERALALDPQSFEAQTFLATALVSRVLDFGSSSEDADIHRAEELAIKAVAASPRSALAHFAKGEVLRVQRRCAEAIPEYEAALALNRNWVTALASIGRCKIFIGPIDEGIAAQERAIRLSPGDPNVWNWYFRIGQGHLLQSRIDDAVLWLERARNANPAPGFVRVYLASAYALKGETERAAGELAEARRLTGEGHWLSISELRAGSRFEAPAIRALSEATFLAGLRKAGVPDE